jgi:hypothetical protein
MRPALAVLLILAACSQPPREMGTGAAFTLLATPLTFDPMWSATNAWRGESATQRFFFYDLASARPRPGQVRVQYLYPKEGQSAALTPLLSAADGAREIARAHNAPVAATAPVLEVRNPHGVAYVQFGQQGTLSCGWAVQHFDEARGVRATACRNGSSLADQTQVREDLREVLAGLRVREGA